MHNQMLPDLKTLRTLKAIQESGSLADAAARLHLTPSALSHQLRELEDAVGMSVLVRKTRPPRFTRAGDRLLMLAELVMEAMRDAERDLGRLQGGSSGRLTLALDCAHSYVWLTPLLGEFQGNWPAVGIDIREQPPAAWARALLDGDIDLYLSSNPGAAESVARVRLFEYELQLVVPPAHALAGHAFVSPDDLREETLLTQPLEEARLDLFREFLDPAGIRPRHVRYVERDDVMIQLVAAGRGVAALPSWLAGDPVARGWLRAVRIGRDGVWCTLHAYLREQDLGLAYVRDFLGSARDACLAQLLGIRPAGAEGARRENA